MKVTSIISGLALVAADALAATIWHMDIIDTLGDMRLDPIVSPNGVASHMHTIMGGSGFGAAYNYDNYADSSCTTTYIQADHSNYWAPKLYWINDNGTSFTPLNEYKRFYYMLEQNSDIEKNHPFPPGLRMLTGDPNNKSPNWFNVRYQCHKCTANNAGDPFSTDFNFNDPCPCGLTVTIGFPQCWDGVNLWKSDMSHMSPILGGTTRIGQCPWSHPIRVPYIFLELTYQTSTWAPGQNLAGNLVWANGDTTGYGAHADFVNGWDLDVLGAALNDTGCNDGNSEKAFTACPIFAKSLDQTAAFNCKNQLGIMNEPSGAQPNNIPIPSLPGCNKLWSSGPKPTCDGENIPDPNIGGFLGTNGPLVAAKPLAPVMPTTPGWAEVACLKGWGLNNYVTYYDNAVTPETCQANCARGGYKFASVGLTAGTKWSCQCATGISDNAAVYWGKCTTACPGDKTKTCGGNDAFKVYAAGPGTIAPPANNLTGYMGCYNDPPSGSGTEASAFYNFALSTVSPATCNAACAKRGATWAGTKNGNTCYCGKDTSFPLNRGWWTADSICSTACVGDSTKKCGGPLALSVYNVTTLAPPVPVNGTNGTVGVITPPTTLPGDLGCFTAGPGSTNVGLNSASYRDTKLTPDRCQFACSQMGYSLGAVLQGSTCQCGNKYVGGPGVPETACQVACAGNKNATCGGNGYAELFNTSTSASAVATVATSKGSSWLGCYNNQALKGPNDWQVVGGNINVNFCKSSCAGLGYGFAGLQNGNTCTCSKADPTKVLTKQPSNMFCTSPCLGNPSGTCGGPYNAVEFYSVDNTTATGIPTTPGYKGCFNGVGGLGSYSMTTSSMTVDLCQTSCKELGFSLAAVSGTTCQCGNNWTGGGILGSVSCNGACPGNSTQMCGSTGRSSVYNTAPAANLTLYNDPQYVGCFVDATVRMLSTYSQTTNALTVDSCKAICKAKGANYAGMENGNQCYCGLTQGLLSKYPQAPSYQCGQKCAGNSNQMCGGLNNWRMSLYKVNTLPVSSSASSSASASASKSISSSAPASSSAAPPKSTAAPSTTSTDDGQWGDFNSLPTSGAATATANAAKAGTGTSAAGSAASGGARNVKCKRNKKARQAKE